MAPSGIPQYEPASMRERDLAERRYPGQNHHESRHSRDRQEALDLGYDPMEIDDVMEDRTKRWKKFKKADLPSQFSLPTE